MMMAAVVMVIRLVALDTAVDDADGLFFLVVLSVCVGLVSYVRYDCSASEKSCGVSCS